MARLGQRRRGKTSMVEVRLRFRDGHDGGQGGGGDDWGLGVQTTGVGVQCSREARGFAMERWLTGGPNLGWIRLRTEVWRGGRAVVHMVAHRRGSFGGGWIRVRADLGGAVRGLGLAGSEEEILAKVKRNG